MTSNKKFINVYFLWLSDNKEYIKKMYFSDYIPKFNENGKIENINIMISKKAGEIWKSLDDSIKDTYKSKFYDYKKNVFESGTSFNEVEDTNVDEDEPSLDEDEDELEVTEITYKGKTYYYDEIYNGVYDPKTSECIGKMINNTINFYNETYDNPPSYETINSIIKSSRIQCPFNCNTYRSNYNLMIKHLETRCQKRPSNDICSKKNKTNTELLQIDYNIENILSKLYNTKINTKIKSQKSENPENPEKLVDKEKKRKRMRIPKAVRKAVWCKYIKTEDPKKLYGNCYIECGKTINIDEFDLAHVIPFSKGGMEIIDNLRPVCRTCNLSMGTTNLYEFKNKYGFDMINIDNTKKINSLENEYKIIKSSIQSIQTENKKLENFKKKQLTIQEEYSILVGINSKKKNSLIVDYNNNFKKLELEFNKQSLNLHEENIKIKNNIKYSQKKIIENTELMKRNRYNIIINKGKIEDIKDNINILRKKL
jgi:hypothetical protein